MNLASIPASTTSTLCTWATHLTTPSYKFHSCKIGINIIHITLILED